jgi:hypothetical protein
LAATARVECEPEDSAASERQACDFDVSLPPLAWHATQLLYIDMGELTPALPHVPTNGCALSESINPARSSRFRPRSASPRAVVVRTPLRLYMSAFAVIAGLTATSATFNWRRW